MLCAAKYDVQWGSVDDEHAKTRAREYTSEVVVIANNTAAEGELELGLDSKDLWQDLRERPRVKMHGVELTLKHWIMNTERYTIDWACARASICFEAPIVWPRPFTKSGAFLTKYAETECHGQQARDSK